MLVQTFTLEGRQNVWARGDAESDLDSLALKLLRQRFTVKVEPIVVAGQPCGFCLTGEKPRPEEGAANA